MYNRKSYLKVIDSDIFYRYQNFKFYFSLTKRRNIFVKRLEKYIPEESLKFYNKYKIPIKDIDLIFAFSLYLKLENRGVKVEQMLDERTVKRVITEIPEFTIYGIGEEND